MLRSDLAVVASRDIKVMFVLEYPHLELFGFIGHSEENQIIFFESYVTSANRG